MTTYPFLKQAARIVNAGETRSLVLTGNVADLYRHEPSGEWLPLTELVARSWDLPDRLVLIYEINGPIRFRAERDRQLVKDAWLKWQTGLDAGDLALQRLVADTGKKQELAQRAASFDEHLAAAIGRPTLAMELLRQFCQCSRGDGARAGAARFLGRDLVVIIEGADLLLPDAPVTQLSDADRQRLHIALDWFSDPAFSAGRDVVVLLAEGLGLLHQRLARLPQLIAVPIPAPDSAERHRFIEQHRTAAPAPQALPEGTAPTTPPTGDAAALARATAGLSLQALRQLLHSARHAGGAVDRALLLAKVEEHIASQLGEDVVSFKKPEHRLKDLVGNTRLKKFLHDELIPRFRLAGKGAIPGCVVGGPIGAGKTYIFEALAAELDLPVLELKNIRSQWFGQTDVVLERLRRVLESLDKVVIIVDEADTQFGGLGKDEHSTERRLTGKIQAMMSEPKLLGRVHWILMTARIHLLSPDIRRPGRVGDLIVPVLDPDDPDDRRAFCAWTLGAVLDPAPAEAVQELAGLTAGWSAASYSALRRELQAKRILHGALDLAAVRAVVADQIPPPIAQTRRYQTLQALVNCTRRSLLPDPTISDEGRAAWEQELRTLERAGVG